MLLLSRLPLCKGLSLNQVPAISSSGPVEYMATYFHCIGAAVVQLVQVPSELLQYPRVLSRVLAVWFGNSESGRINGTRRLFLE